MSLSKSYPFHSQTFLRVSQTFQIEIPDAIKIHLIISSNFLKELKNSDHNKTKFIEIIRQKFPVPTPILIDLEINKNQ